MTNIIPLQNDWLQDREIAKKQIRKVIREWKPILDMGNWTFEITFYRDKYKASCYAEPEYRRAHLNIWLGYLLTEWKTNYELEEFIVHEMIHCLTWTLVTMTERLIDNFEKGYTRKELWRNKEDSEELFVQRMSDSLVMAKYDLKTIPDSIRLRAARKDRRAEGFSTPKKKSKKRFV